MIDPPWLSSSSLYSWVRTSSRCSSILSLGRVRVRFALGLGLGLGSGLGLEEVFVFDSKSENRDIAVEAVKSVSEARG